MPDNASASEIQCLQDLVVFNSMHNPHHVFCYQSRETLSDHNIEFTCITFKQLAQAVEVCCSRIIAQTEGAQPGELETNGYNSKKAPIALFFESSISLFIHLLALTALQIPVSKMASS